MDINEVFLSMDINEGFYRWILTKFFIDGY